MYYEFFDENNELVDVQMSKDRTAAKRRAKNLSKAKRKQRLAKQIYGIDWYKYLHQYSKNKIHCSCPLCAFHGPTFAEMKNQEKVKYEMSIAE